jgi:hypothetical protein
MDSAHIRSALWTLQSDALTCSAFLTTETVGIDTAWFSCLALSLVVTLFLHPLRVGPFIHLDSQLYFVSNAKLHAPFYTTSDALSFNAYRALYIDL